MLRFVSLGAWLCVLLVGGMACDDDDVTETVTYDITIVNTIDAQYGLWVDVSVDEDGFVEDGVLDALGERVLVDRDVKVGYHIRLTLPGQDPDMDEFEHETTIFSEGQNITWEVREPDPEP